MQRVNGIFGSGTNFQDRLIPDFKRMSEVVSACRVMGYKIVLTQGTFDLAYPGYALYLEKARSFGDMLIVGVDSDEKTRYRKGPKRPLIPQDERLIMLAHFRHVDILFLKEQDHPHWELIRTVRPDVLVVSESTKPYSKDELASLGEFCGRVEVLPPQAVTSASARIRRFQMDIVQVLGDELRERLTKVVGEVVAKHTGEK
jgi:D-beta-D-heptose 7-phosphate kinase/D-beta-D-heptose 1-phosphate adenosyltransferase